MKTLFICMKQAIIRHVDEEYDEIVYVDNNSTTQTIDKESSMIKDAIHRLDATDTSDDKRVVVTIDAAPPIWVVIEYLTYNMKQQENITIELSQKK